MSWLIVFLLSLFGGFGHGDSHASPPRSVPHERPAAQTCPPPKSEVSPPPENDVPPPDQTVPPLCA
jgi:hypothetical protein